MSMILTSECENCIHGELYKVGKIEKVHCAYKEKDYYYGQCIPCEHKQKKKDEEEQNVRKEETNESE